MANLKESRDKKMKSRIGDFAPKFDYNTYSLVKDMSMNSQVGKISDKKSRASGISDQNLSLEKVSRDVNDLISHQKQSFEGRANQP